jgi:glycosyltransferase involved in cell wall biosynthesis
MSYHANEAAALYLLKEIMPIVWHRRPDVELWIVGKDPSELLKSAVDSRVQLTGYVDDIRPYLRNSAISVSPVVYGSGIQNKVLEAMACATPVVATSQATAALDVVSGRDLVIADDAEAFGKEILNLLEHPRRRTAIGRQGRKFVEQNHSWDAVTAQLEQIYEAELRRGSSVEDEPSPSLIV